MRVEPYDPSLGCLAIAQGNKWLVVCPVGEIVARYDDEYEARNDALYRNLTENYPQEDRWTGS